jgi:hypothetical protein
VPSNSAAYMREYRARKKAAVQPYVGQEIDPGAWYLGRITELEEEVRRLKSELAKRPAPVPTERFNTRPFTPVPKRRG